MFTLIASFSRDTLRNSAGAGGRENCPRPDDLGLCELVDLLAKSQGPSAPLKKLRAVGFGGRPRADEAGVEQIREANRSAPDQRQQTDRSRDCPSAAPEGLFQTK